MTLTIARRGKESDMFNLNARDMKDRKRGRHKKR